MDETMFVMSLSLSRGGGVFSNTIESAVGAFGSTGSACGRLVGGELGHGLGALGDGVLGELTGEDEAHGGLDLLEVTVGFLL